MLFNKKIILSFFCLLSFSVYAADIVVNGSGLAGTYTTISAGINAASPGDRVLVSNQSFPYQEDTIFINKSVTILPYNDVSHIHFEGHIKITLDSISELNLIGFNCPQTQVFSEFNDTSRNSLTTVNIVDCDFDNVLLSNPKTSTYISHSTIRQSLHISHGDAIACDLHRFVFGDFYDASKVSSPIDMLRQFDYHKDYNPLDYSSYPSACELFTDYVNFGNVNTYSDTCNIIANEIETFVWLTKDFVLNIRNNDFGYYGVSAFLMAPPNVGTNQFINNGISGGNSFDFCLAYCSNTNEFNFRDIAIRILNNDGSYGSGVFFMKPPNNSSPNTYNLGNLSPINNSIYSYNNSTNFGYDYNLSALEDSMFLIGPSGPSAFNPSSEFLNLDLSLNSKGKSGGSYAWDNIIGGTSGPGFGSIQNSSTNSKARITYLNLPTQIFDPANIKIKAKAIHGN